MIGHKVVDMASKYEKEESNKSEEFEDASSEVINADNRSGDITAQNEGREEEEIVDPTSIDMTIQEVEGADFPAPVGQGTRDSTANDYTIHILEKYGLREYFPAKISLRDVMTIGQAFEKDKDSIRSVPWLILQKLIMLDHRARDQKYACETTSESEGGQERTDTNSEDVDDPFELKSVMEAENNNVNPVDLLHVVFTCCDLNLRQVLVQKMYQCRLALPFIFPGDFGKDLCFSLWPLRNIFVECRNEKDEAIESSMASVPQKVVSVLRLGRPNFSKSKVLNFTISNQKQDVFFNMDCDNGDTPKKVVNGLVEASFFLPSGSKTDHFKDITMFLNLRGDACNCNRQVSVLNKLSNVVVTCVDINDLGKPEIITTIKSIHRYAEKVLLLILDKDRATSDKGKLRNVLSEYRKQIGTDVFEKTKKIYGFNSKRDKTESEIKCELIDKLKECLENTKGKPIMDVAQLANEAKIDIDEEFPECQDGRRYAEKIMTFLSGKSLEDIKKEMFPLQGEHWFEWSKHLKCYHRSKGSKKETSLEEKEEIKKKMKKLRETNGD